ncbi:MAG: type II toxin-antitoxin system VapC family toxin [Acidobacteriota bacterium]
MALNRYLLDTNIWIALAKGERGPIVRLQSLSPEQVYSCSVVRAELMFGAQKSQFVERTVRGFERLLAPFVSLPFDDDAATVYGVIRADLERVGTPIGANDLLIAGIARAVDCILVTRNLREFDRVAGLRVELWE